MLVSFPMDGPLTIASNMLVNKHVLSTFQVSVKQSVDWTCTRSQWHGSAQHRVSQTPVNKLINHSILSLIYYHKAWGKFRKLWLNIQWLTNYCRDFSNNSFDATDIPPWFSSLPSLTTLYFSLSISFCREVFEMIAQTWYSNWTCRIMDNTQIQGQLPISMFSISQLQTMLVNSDHCDVLFHLHGSRFYISSVTILCNTFFLPSAHWRTIVSMVPWMLAPIIATNYSWLI